jgi:hypothetical protein
VTRLYVCVRVVIIVHLQMHKQIKLDSLLDASPLRFPRVALGDSETFTRVLVNEGDIDVTFSLVHGNLGKNTCF